MHFTIISSIKRTEKCRESPREETPKESKKKNVKHPKGKRRKEDDSRTTGRVRNERVTCFACFFSPLSAFSLCHEKKTRQRKRRLLLLRVYVQLRFYETCVYVIENKKKNREPFLYFCTRGKSQHKKYDLPLVLAFVFLVFVCRDHERDALFVVRCEEEEEEKRRTTPVVLLPRVAWSMREKRCIDQTPCFTK